MLPKGFSGTKMATTGGFLRTGNSTLIVGTEEERVSTVIDIVKNECGLKGKFNIIIIFHMSIVQPELYFILFKISIYFLTFSKCRAVY